MIGAQQEIPERWNYANKLYVFNFSPPGLICMRDLITDHGVEWG